MAFFDKKEEVIDIQLTQYGKYLLSQGKFKPTQYAFFDSDVTYDSDYTDSTEQQNDSEKRIENAIRPKTQYVFSPGPETEITKGNINILHNKTEEFLSFVSDFFDTSVELTKETKLTNKQQILLAKEMVQPAALKDYVLSQPLGTSEFNSRYAPAWDVQFLNGEITGSQSILSSSDGIAQIPQLYATSSFEIYTTYMDESGDLIRDFVPDELDLGVFSGLSVEDTLAATDGSALDPEFNSEDFTYSDNSLFQIRPDYFLLEILEKNTDFEKENFEIEVYKVDNGEQELLLFRNDESEELTPRHVGYYFDLLVDDEIDDEIFCASKHIHKRRHIFSDQDRVFNCLDNEKQPVGNVYNTFITDKDYEEPC